jgi:Cofactor assembly of complex C subunit B
MHACPPGLGSAALVLSIAAPFGGNLWYLITLISPAAGAYYLRKGDRQEEVRILCTRA